MFAILVYLAAIALPFYALHHFHAVAWYWHLLAIAVAVSLGFYPVPVELQRRGFDLVFGFAIVALLFWGIGGFIVPRAHREKHA